MADARAVVERLVETINAHDTAAGRELYTPTVRAISAAGKHLGSFAGLDPTGRRVRLPMVHITRVRDGHIVERVAYHDTAGILRQLTA
jgi:ketosteroid isomerase-like protein